MIEHFEQRNAQHAFDRALRRGRRDTGVLSRLRGCDNRVLQLREVLEVVPRRGESYLGVQDVAVERIVGTESRGDDYSRGFHPRKRMLASRWMTVYRLLANTEFNEPIRVVELGGVYFVRDGNHRVSVARSLDRSYLTAEVSRYELPFSLSCDIDRNRVTLVEAKARFHAATEVFAVFSDRNFAVARPRTWDYLAREILRFNYEWFRRRFGREPESRAEQIATWYTNLYGPALEFIRNHHDTYLFRGMRETDVFVEMLRLWNSQDDPDTEWFGTVYQRFVARQRLRNLVGALPQVLRNVGSRLTESPEDEYRRFLAVSRVHELGQEFQALPKQRGFYRFLHHELVHRAAGGLTVELGRAPHTQELTRLWYLRFYLPVAAAARLLPEPEQQTAFYRRFSRDHLSAVMQGLTTAQQQLGNAAR